MPSPEARPSHSVGTPIEHEPVSHDRMNSMVVAQTATDEQEARQENSTEPQSRGTVMEQGIASIGAWTTEQPIVHDGLTDYDSPSTLDEDQAPVDQNPGRLHTHDTEAGNQDAITETRDIVLIYTTAVAVWVVEQTVVYDGSNTQDTDQTSTEDQPNSKPSSPDSGDKA